MKNNNRVKHSVGTNGQGKQGGKVTTGKQVKALACGAAELTAGGKRKLERLEKERGLILEARSAVIREFMESRAFGDFHRSAHELDNMVSRAKGLLHLLGERLGQAAVDYNFARNDRDQAEALHFIADDVAEKLKQGLDHLDAAFAEMRKGVECAAPAVVDWKGAMAEAGN